MASLFVDIIDGKAEKGPSDHTEQGAKRPLCQSSKVSG